MKVNYKHLISKINNKPSIDELSKNLFQLGHEHEIDGDIFNMELTPNRGDCLSLNGLLRDLKIFYDIDILDNIYDSDIDTASFEFSNNAREFCPKISFLRIDVEHLPTTYSSKLEDYFKDFNLKKNNFFTDISNYISYETGQPTHCYDAKKLGNELKLNYIDHEQSFETLLEKEIALKGKNLVFYNKNNSIVNLAGIVGSKDSSCDKSTNSVIIECAFFNPEVIIGKSTKYAINSEAAHKFERHTDPSCHDYVIRRLIRIVEENAEITKLELASYSYEDFEKKTIRFDLKKINKILGINISESLCKKHLNNLGFNIKDEIINVPMHRSDIKNLNDISEEIARAIGYDSIINKPFTLPNKLHDKNFSYEDKLRLVLTSNGFYEVINNPFVSDKNDNSIIVDNPLDTNKNYIRTDLKKSLLNNLLYNERRQQDSIKLFEISNIYRNGEDNKVVGIIASGRVDKNYEDFSKSIGDQYIKNILDKIFYNFNYKFEKISRDQIESKNRSHISYIEFEIDSSLELKENLEIGKKREYDFIKYSPISEFPCSIRDLSFSVKDNKKLRDLENLVLEEKNELIKDCFIFDFYNNEKNNEIKIGFRFVFQSKIKTITDKEVDNVISKIIEKSRTIESINIPGLK